MMTSFKLPSQRSAATALLLFCLLAFQPPSLQALDVIWDGDTDGSWMDGTNWVGDAAPIAATDSISFSGIINTSTTNDFAPLTSFLGISFTNDGAVGTQDAAFTLAGASITLGGDITTTAMTTGTLEDIISLDLILDANRTVTALTDHDLRIDGNISGLFTLLIGNGDNVNDEALVTLSGTNTHTQTTLRRLANVRIESNTALGNAAVFQRQGDLTLVNGIDLTADGGITFTNSNQQQNIFLDDGAATSINATINALTELTLNNVGTANNRRVQLQIGENDTLTIDGLIQSSNSNADKILRKLGAGTVILTAANTFDGQLQANLGTIQLNNALAAQSASVTNNAGTVVFDSSVGGNAFTFGAMNGGGNLVLENNDGSPAAIALTIGGHAANRSHSGDISGAGSIIINTNAGVVQSLTGDNTYTGTTSVIGGRLDIEGEVNVSAITVASGAALGGDGANSGGITFLNGSILSIDQQANADELKTTGTLDTSGGNISIVFDEARNTAGATVDLIDHSGGSWTGAVGNFNALSRDTVQDTAGVIQLVQAAAQTHSWSGVTNTTWDVDTSANWTSTDNLFAPSDTVTFGDTGVGTLTLDDSNGEIFPEQITFANTAGNDYTFNGSDLRVNNDVFFNNTGNVTFDNNIQTVGSSLTLNDAATGNVTINGIVSGTTSIDHDGTGTLTLSGVNTHTGGTTVRSGATLSATVERALGATSATTVIEDGGTLMLSTGLDDYADGAIQVQGAGVGGLGAIQKIAGGNSNFDDFDFTGDVSLRTSSSRLQMREFVVSGTDIAITALGGTIRIDTDTSALSIGSWVVEDGTLLASNTDALTGNSATIVVNGGTVQTDSGMTISNAITLNGGRVRADGNNATGTVSGTITVTADSRIEADGTGGGGASAGNNSTTLNLSGTLTGAANVETGDGGLNNLVAGFDASGLTGTWTQTGDNRIRINDGQTINSLASTNVASFFDLLANLLTTGDSGSTTYAGIIEGIGGGLKKVGSGTFSLSGANTYTGTTEIDAGRLDVTATGSLTSAINVGALGTLGGEGTTTGNIVFATGGILAVDGSGVGTDAFGTTADFDSSAGVSVLVDKSGVGAFTIMDYFTWTNSLGLADFSINAGGIQAGARGFTFADTGMGGAGSITLDLGYEDANWLGTVDNKWDVATTGNWGTSDTFFQTGDNVIFAEGPTNITPTLQSNITANDVTFSNTATIYTIMDNGGGETLTVDGTINANNTAAATISAAVAGGTSGLNLAGTGTAGLTISGAVDGSGGISHNGTTAVTISGVVTAASGLNITGTDNTASLTISSIFSGAGALSKQSTGLVTLSGDNTYSGGTTLGQGQLLVTHNNGLGTDDVTLQDDGAEPILVLGNGTTITNHLIVSDTGGAKALRLEANLAGGHSATYAGTITLNETGANNFDIDVNNGTAINNDPTQLLTISGQITGNGAGVGSSSIDVNGDGTLELTNASNNFLGDIRIVGNSTLLISNDAALSSATLIANVGSSEIRLTGGTTTDNPITLTSNSGVKRLSLTAGGMTGIFSGDILVTEETNGNFEIKANGANNDDQTQVLTVSGNITATSGSGVEINTDGVVHLTGDNAISGIVDLSNRGSILRVGHNNALGGDSGATTHFGNRNIKLQLENGVTTHAANNLVVEEKANGARVLEVLDAGGSESATFSGNIDIQEVDAGQFDLQAGTDDTLTLSGVISESGAGASGIDKTGAGTVILSGANTYVAATTINAGTLQIGDGGTTGSLSTSSAIVNNGTLAFNRSDDIVQGTDFSTAAITGSGGITQLGSGTTTLTAANTYTGPTNVTAGTLLINGDHSGATGAVTVGTGATLGGIGTIGGATTIESGATHTAGTTTGAGTQTFAGNLTVNNGSTITWNLISGSVAGPNTAGSDWDLFDVDGVLAFETGAAASKTFDIQDTSSFDFASLAAMATFDFLVWENASAPTGFDSMDFSILYNGGASGPAGGSFALKQDGNNIALSFTAIPEPSTYAIFGLGLALFGWTARRRRKQASAVVSE